MAKPQGILAARERFAKKRSARAAFYGKYTTASERRQARERGESPTSSGTPPAPSASRRIPSGGGGGGSRADFYRPSVAPKAVQSAATGKAPAEQVALANKYGKQKGVDPKLLLGIAMHETAFGTKGLGRKGLTLGVGAYDRGAVNTWAGNENQYRKGAELLSKWGALTLDDVLGGKAKRWATDPAWEQGVARAYRSL